MTKIHNQASDVAACHVATSCCDTCFDNVFENCATLIPCTLSQSMWSMRESCTVMCAREKCASARVQVGVVSTASRRIIQPLLQRRPFPRVPDDYSPTTLRNELICCELSFRLSHLAYFFHFDVTPRLQFVHFSNLCPLQSIFAAGICMALLIGTGECTKLS